MEPVAIAGGHRFEEAEVLGAFDAIVTKFVDRRVFAPVLVFKADIPTARDIVVAFRLAGLTALTAINDSIALKEVRASGQERGRQLVRAFPRVAGHGRFFATASEPAIGAQREAVAFRALDRGIRRHAIEVEWQNDDAPRNRIKGAASNILAIGTDGNPLAHETQRWLYVFLATVARGAAQILIASAAKTKLASMGATFIRGNPLDAQAAPRAAQQFIRAVTLAARFLAVAEDAVVAFRRRPWVATLVVAYKERATSSGGDRNTTSRADAAFTKRSLEATFLAIADQAIVAGFFTRLTSCATVDPAVEEQIASGQERRREIVDALLVARPGHVVRETTFPDAAVGAERRSSGRRAGFNGGDARTGERPAADNDHAGRRGLEATADVLAIVADRLTAAVEAIGSRIRRDATGIGAAEVRIAPAAEWHAAAQALVERNIFGTAIVLGAAEHRLGACPLGARLLPVAEQDVEAWGRQTRRAEITTDVSSDSVDHALLEPVADQTIVAVFRAVTTDTAVAAFRTKQGVRTFRRRAGYTARVGIFIWVGRAGVAVFQPIAKHAVIAHISRGRSRGHVLARSLRPHHEMANVIKAAVIGTRAAIVAHHRRAWGTTSGALGTNVGSGCAYRRETRRDTIAAILYAASTDRRAGLLPVAGVAVVTGGRSGSTTIRVLVTSLDAVARIAVVTGARRAKNTSGK